MEVFLITRVEYEECNLLAICQLSGLPRSSKKEINHGPYGCLEEQAHEKRASTIAGIVISIDFVCLTLGHMPAELLSSVNPCVY